MRRFARKLFRVLIACLIIFAILLLLFREKYGTVITSLAETQIKNTTSDLINDAIAKQIANGNIQYDRTKITENKSKPDFIFPSLTQYHNVTFPTDKLTMLGTKSTCKDRWRQVLAEADRIKHKHLLTLEAAISTNQTNEMKRKNLQLVVPKPIHKTYTQSQQEWLMDINTFFSILQEKQFSIK